MKDYKRILQGVVNIINITKKSDIGFVNICAYIDEKCPELKESEDEKIKKCIIDTLKGYHHLISTGGITKEAMIAWVEKQGKKKHTDKVELKFQKGQWIVWLNKCYKVNHNGCGYELIDQMGLRTSLEYGTVDESAHLWTIEDAKDGDVLATENFIFIFKNIDNGNGVHYYCQYEISKHENDKQFDIALPQSLMGRVGNSITHYSPATKEQRDLLFKKMHDAGYEWDAEKKELKKIDEEVNGEDYGIDGLYHAIRILEETLGKVDGYQTDDGILEHKCAISAVKELSKQQKSAWSEVDEKIIKRIDSLLYSQCKIHGSEYEEIHNWLKALKERVGNFDEGYKVGFSAAKYNQ